MQGARCYISCFYIKPQPFTEEDKVALVATFLVSTSNRNRLKLPMAAKRVATFLVSTSNRNAQARLLNEQAVATFLVSTSNRNHLRCYRRCLSGCYISCFYIKPQLKQMITEIAERCYISCFYIKPQLCSAFRE